MQHITSSIQASPRCYRTLCQSSTEAIKKAVTAYTDGLALCSTDISTMPENPLLEASNNLTIIFVPALEIRHIS